MGVNGLWTVIQPCARPTNLATLNQKRLAVDASIWIYQFLKAVRDKEGNALRNSHIVGFFRRICKLLWFGIRPVFVFDGGAPALKRQTISNRKRRREGRRDDAVRTAGKLLAVQMQRIAEEEAEKRRRRRDVEQEPVEEIPDIEKLVYVDEIGMSQQERQKSRKFYKQDAYHLPELDVAIDGRPEDPRIMSIQELEEYAKQFHRGEDINLYDFSKIDFDGDFFKSLPAADRYNILNAARIRSRLRMGLSKDQLADMFPDRMAFSRFQIERVQERNRLTQRLMKESGAEADLTVGVNGRIAGEKDREYILVKNEGAEGGWALGVVSGEKDRGEIHKPIDVDALDIQYEAKDEDLDWEDDEFEDVPIEGLNRLPKLQAQSGDTIFEAIADEVDSLFVGGNDSNEEESLFVGENDTSVDMAALLGASYNNEALLQDEEEDLNRAIALSLKNQHGVKSPTQEAIEVDDEDEEFEDVPAPEWTQKAVEQPKPITSNRGRIIAHIVNNRANAAVPKRRASNSSSGSDMDLRSAALAARKKKLEKARAKPQSPTIPTAMPSVNSPFNGPLPFEKLDWKSTIFAKKPNTTQPLEQTKDSTDEDGDLAGGFMPDAENDDKPRPLPPWMIQDETDIREVLKAQQENEKEINEADRAAAAQEEKRRQKDIVIEIRSSDDSDSDVEIIDPPPPRQQSLTNANNTDGLSHSLTSASPVVDQPLRDSTIPETEEVRGEDVLNEQSNEDLSKAATLSHRSKSPSSSPEPEFEEVEIVQPPEESNENPSPHLAALPLEPENLEEAIAEAIIPDDSGEIPTIDANDIPIGEDELDFSDPEEEELLAQMAEEAEEHARFASQLNNKSEKENQEAYERELKALRAQQKKDRRDADEVTQIMITECQALLRYFGIPYITAPMEAEAQCAQLVNLGLVDGVVTDDSDIFLFGGTRVYKNMFNSNKFVECYLGSDLEREMSLSREQLISIAQLLGSDYTDGLPGVGPVTAVEILSEFPGRDGLAKFREWWQEGRPKEPDTASTFRKKFRKSQALKLFLPPGFPSPAVFDAYLHPEVDHSTEPFQWGSPDVEGLRQFLMSTIGWSQERTDEVLVPVIRDMNRREAEGTQSNITRFFEGGVGVGVKEAFAPRQRVPTSKRMAQAVNKLRTQRVVDAVGVVVEDGVVGDDGVEVQEDVSLAPGQKRKGTAGDAEADEDYEEEDGVERKKARGKGKGTAKATGKGKGKGKGKAK